MNKDWQDCLLVVAAFAGALFSGSLLAQQPENAYDSFHLEGTIVSSELQPFAAEGPPGAGEEPVCLLRVQPYFHVHLPEHPVVDVWMQGGGVTHCLEWGEQRVGGGIVVDGYLSVVSVEGEERLAAKMLHASISGDQ